MLRRLSSPRTIFTSRGSPKNEGKVILGEGGSTADQGNENLFNGACIQTPDKKRYVCQERIGAEAHGAHGVIYRARDQSSGKDIAIKFVYTIDNDHTHAQNEAKMHELRGTLVSPAFKYEGKHSFFFVIPMQYIDGKTLCNYLKNTPNRSLNHCYELTIKLRVLVEKLHKADIAHGDINLNNLMIDQHGNLHLIDLDRATTNVNSDEPYESTPIYQLPQDIKLTRREQDMIALMRCIYMDNRFIFRSALFGECIYSVNDKDQAIFKSENNEINLHASDKIKPLLSTSFVNIDEDALTENHARLAEEVRARLDIVNDCTSFILHLAGTSPRPIRALTLAALEYEKLKLTDKSNEFKYANILHAQIYPEDDTDDIAALSSALKNMGYPNNDQESNPFFENALKLIEKNSESYKIAAPHNQNTFYGESSNAPTKLDASLRGHKNSYCY